MPESLRNPPKSSRIEEKSPESESINPEQLVESSHSEGSSLHGTSAESSGFPLCDEISVDRIRVGMTSSPRAEFLTKSNAQHHLTLLEHFRELLDSAASTEFTNLFPEEIFSTEKRMVIFLSIAEVRYMQYKSVLHAEGGLAPPAMVRHQKRQLQLCARLTQPRDVAILFYTHFLWPGAFRRGFTVFPYSPLWDAGIAYPLARLCDLISGSWNDNTSEAAWEDRSCADTPYQMWDADPRRGGRIRAPFTKIIGFQYPKIYQWRGRFHHLTFSHMTRESPIRYPDLKYPGLSFEKTKYTHLRFESGGYPPDSRETIRSDKHPYVWGMFALMPGALGQLDHTGFASKITKLIKPHSSSRTIIRAQRRYLKFMGLMKKEGM